MNAKNNKDSGVLFQYLTTKQLRKSIRIAAGATVEIADYLKPISVSLVFNQWVTLTDGSIKNAEAKVVSKINKIDAKMTEAKNNVEDYIKSSINDIEEETETFVEKMKDKLGSLKKKS